MQQKITNKSRITEIQSIYKFLIELYFEQNTSISFVTYHALQIVMVLTE